MKKLGWFNSLRPTNPYREKSEDTYVVNHTKSYVTSVIITITCINTWFEGSLGVWKNQGLIWNPFFSSSQYQKNLN